MAVTNKANIVAVMGGSGSGKSTFIKQEIKRLKPKRIVIFDVMHEYGEYAQPIKSLLEFNKLTQQSSFKIAFQPSTRVMDKQFEYVCGRVFELGDIFFTVEELNRLTEPMRAPPAWQDCTSRGRHRGLMLYGASQRPAGVDKDFFSNATRVRTGRLNFAADIKTLANVLDVPQSDVKNLKPLEYIERDTGTGAVTRGKINF
jgi:DNA helicase HerA-like ATPase